jgi:hypothetical protein
MANIRRMAAGTSMARSSILIDKSPVPPAEQADERIGAAIRDPREDANREIGGPGEGA